MVLTVCGLKFPNPSWAPDEHMQTLVSGIWRQKCQKHTHTHTQAPGIFKTRKAKDRTDTIPKFSLNLGLVPNRSRWIIPVWTNSVSCKNAVVESSILLIDCYSHGHCMHHPQCRKSPETHKQGQSRVQHTQPRSLQWENLISDVEAGLVPAQFPSTHPTSQPKLLKVIHYKVGSFLPSLSSPPTTLVALCFKEGKGVQYHK